MNAKKSIAFQGFFYVIILLIIALVIGFFAFFTNGFTEDYKSFYVVINGERILSYKDGYYLEKTSPPLEVEVKYALASVGDKKSGYSVSVLPNADYEFDFTVDGDTMSFCAEDDYSAGFNIVKSENSFTISPKGSLLTILQTLYPDKEIEFDYDSLDKTANMFTLVITSYNGKDSVDIGFRVLRMPIEIYIDPEEIIF